MMMHGRTIEPFLGEGGGSSQRALSTPLPETKARLPPWPVSNHRTPAAGGQATTALTRPHTPQHIPTGTTTRHPCPPRLPRCVPPPPRQSSGLTRALHRQDRRQRLLNDYREVAQLRDKLIAENMVFQRKLNNWFHEKKQQETEKHGGEQQAVAEVENRYIQWLKRLREERGDVEAVKKSNEDSIEEYRSKLQAHLYKANEFEAKFKVRWLPGPPQCPAPAHTWGRCSARLCRSRLCCVRCLSEKGQLVIGDVRFLRRTKT